MQRKTKSPSCSQENALPAGSDLARSQHGSSRKGPCRPPSCSPRRRAGHHPADHAAGVPSNPPRAAPKRGASELAPAARRKPPLRGTPRPPALPEPRPAGREAAKRRRGAPSLAPPGEAEPPAAASAAGRKTGIDGEERSGRARPRGSRCRALPRPPRRPTPTHSVTRDTAMLTGTLRSLKAVVMKQPKGYNVDTLTIDQVTPLHEACLGDHVGCARILLEAGANVNATTIDGVTPLFNACSRGSAACAELLLEYGAKAQWESCLPSPTHEAASRGHSECLEVLISWGIDVDQDLPHLGTPLYVACVSQQIHCIRKLLYAGANVQKGKHLETPLHAAAQHSSTEIVNLLLEFGADINAKNTDFERPVDLAAPRSLVERLLLLHEATPSSLCQLCRLRIRNYIGRARLHLVPQLQLPTILKNFLQYR
uniref:Ankyrin repeat and SOCS box containing 5 n=1 Tax=Phasianus colchicus TaxID=9054 RepID=A0A669PUN3_PHACC